MENKKVWFITGASKGLGLALTKLLLKNGDQVAATSRDIAEFTKQSLGTMSEFLPLKLDITDEAEVKQAIQKTVDHFGQIDRVVNNAGYALLGSLEEVSDKEFRQTMDVNVFGAANVIRSVVPFLRKQQSGHIFNFASIGGYRGAASGGTYNAAKFAVLGMSEALAAELKPFNINVTVVAPGFFRTSFLDKGSEMVAKNRIEAYQSTTNSLNSMEKMNGKQPGDPQKLVAALVKISAEPNPPVHLLMGPDAYKIVIDKQNQDKAEFEKWKALTESTDFQ